MMVSIVPRASSCPAVLGLCARKLAGFTAFVVPGRIDAQEIMQSLRDLKSRYLGSRQKKSSRGECMRNQPLEFALTKV